MNKWQITGILIVTILVVWMLWAYLIVKNTEQPNYTVIESDGEFETRQYDGYIIASTDNTDGFSDMNSSFTVIADYIFGNNVSAEDPNESEKIAMTTPVLNQGSNYGQMAFVMPSNYTLDTLPSPVRDNVSLTEVEPFKAVVITFSWFGTENRFNQKREELEAYVLEKELDVKEYKIARYNPPFTPPFMQRHEVWAILK